MTEEYLKNDHLAVSVKSGLAEEIKNAYRVFGWRLEDEHADKRYNDLVHMKFVRDHKIAGKDRLQLLQVRFDVAINFMGKAGGRIGKRALGAGLTLALFGIACVICGALLLANFTAKLFVACGVALISAGAAAFILCALSARLLYAQDKRTYTGALAVIAENIRTTVKEASLITGILPQGATAEDIAQSVAEGLPQEGLPPAQDGGQESPAAQRSSHDIPAPNGVEQESSAEHGSVQNDPDGAGSEEGGDGN